MFLPERLLDGRNSAAPSCLRKLWTRPSMVFTECSLVVVECAVFLKALHRFLPSLGPSGFCRRRSQVFQTWIFSLGLAEGLLCHLLTWLCLQTTSEVPQNLAEEAVKG